MRDEPVIFPQNLKVALVGYGYAGKTIHAPLIRAAAGLELATVVSSRPGDVHDDLPGMTVCDLDTALGDSTIDMVVIATPNDLHASQAHAALTAGKHVVIDKPFALSVAEGQAVIDHAKQASKMVSVFHCRRWDSNHLTFQSLRPRLGELYQFVVRYDRLRPVVRDRWRERAGPGSGIWYDLGSHLLDQALTLFGAPEWIQADLADQRPGATTTDYFHAVLGYGRLRVILHAAMMTAAPGPSLEVQGAQGAFVKYGLDTQEEMLKAGRTPGDRGWGEDPASGLLTSIVDGVAGEPEAITNLAGNYLAYYEGVARAIRDDGPNPVPAEEALDVMRWLDLGQRSADEGRRITG